MKVSTRNINLVRERLKKLYGEFNINPLDRLNEPQIGDEDIYIQYPDDIIEEGISVEDFMDYTADLDHLVKESDSTVRMGGIRQTIVSIDSFHYDYLVPVITYEDEILSMKIIENPVLIGFIASKEGIYNEDYGVYPCSTYMAVEMRYKADEHYSREYENELINRFLYHIASHYDVAIEVGTFEWWEDLTGEDKPDPYRISKESLIPYSEAMAYYSKALRIFDPDIQFHHLYKIIEHFSPIVSKKLAYEKLNQKLDALSVVSRDYQYLDSLLELSKYYELSKSDNVLCKTVLIECVDIVPIFKLLPQKIRKGIKNKCSFQFTDISNCSRKEVEQIKTEVGEVIYATRNRIVHAKMNWEKTDYACSGADMDEMNEFMKALAQCLIVWNGRQPKEFQV